MDRHNCAVELCQSEGCLLVVQKVLAMCMLWQHWQVCLEDMAVLEELQGGQLAGALLSLGLSSVRHLDVVGLMHVVVLSSTKPRIGGAKVCCRARAVERAEGAPKAVAYGAVFSIERVNC